MHSLWDGTMRLYSSAAILLILVLAHCSSSFAGKPVSTKPAAKPDAEYIRKMIPTKIVGNYKGGELVPFKLRDRNAYVVKPTIAEVDPQRRWIWIFPFWLGINDGHGSLQHREYVEKYLAAGFHVAGIDVGTSCGSPTAAVLCQEFYETVRADYKVNPRARLLGQSNGGLIAYAWAFRHPESVDRIAGICPATDFRTWPTLPNVVNFPVKGLGYDLPLEELTKRQKEFNPIDNLTPLAKANVKILHIHGDKDELVPMEANSTELARRYKSLNGSAEIVVLEGLGHGGKVLYESKQLVKFLIAQ